ncbi:MAG TPA: glycosyltransferase, partial [Terriglobales bacterium]
MPNVEHVAFAIHSLGGGGAERVAVFLANEMSRRGVRVDLVVLDPSGTYLPLVSPRVRIVKLGPSRVRYAVPALVRYLKTFEPQFFVSAVLHMNLATSIAWQWSQVPTRLILTETMNPAEHRTRTIYLRFRLAYAVAPFLYRRASQVVAVSEGAATAAAKVYGLRVDQLRAIPNPVLPDDWEKLAQEPVENDWFSGDGPPVVLAAGRLVPQKDFGNLIRAFTILRRHIDARLVILGEGPERAKLETLISAAGLRESVSLPGVVTNPIRFMARANAFVLSSLHEGM